MGSGGGRGGYSGSTETEPWAVQEDYLRSIFKRAQAMSTGKEEPKSGDYNVKDSPDINPYALFGPDTMRLGYFGNDADSPLGGVDPSLGGSGAPLGGGSAWWSPNTAVTRIVGANPEVPTIAPFTDTQLSAQELAKSTAYEGLNPNSLESQAERSLMGILSGANTITPQTFGAARVSPLSNVNVPYIQSLGSMIDPNIRASTASWARATPQQVGTSERMYGTSVNETPLNYQYYPELSNTIAGNYLYGESNPYLQGTFDAASRNVTRGYLENILPNIDSTAQAAGRYGSGAWSDLRSQANQDYLNSIEDLSAGIYGPAYESERGRMMQSLGLGGELSQADLNAQLQRNVQNAVLGQQAGLTNVEQGFNRALENARLGQQAESQTVGNLQQAGVRNAEMANELLANQLGLGLQRGIAQTGYEAQIPLEMAGLTSTQNIQNALMEQEARKMGAGMTQEAQGQNIANMMQSLGITPTVNELDYTNLARLAGAGEEEQNMNQAVLDALIKRYEFQKQEPYTLMQLLSGLVSGNYGGTSTSDTSAVTKSGGKF